MMTDGSPGIFRRKVGLESMQINGEWLLCDDGIERPVMRGEVLSGDGFWRANGYESLGMSVLGRDILDHFAVIVDRSNQ